MKLIKLHLSNFKGIRNFTLDAQGQSVSVFGDNATGKTSVMDGFLWLLYGKDSANKADFEIKTLDKYGQVLHGLDHTVEAELEINDQQLTLKKVYREVYTKKRGSAQQELTGHTTDHYIDGVPVQKKEYDAKIAEIADESVFKLLTSPSYFNEQLHWKDRRKLLLEICGDISDTDVIASDKALERLPEIVGKRSLEDHKKVIAARRAEINRELERIPVRIDEAQRSLPDISKLVPVELDADIARLQTEQQELEQQLVRIQSGGEVAEVRRQIAEVETKLLDLKNSVRGAVDKQIADKRRELNSVIGAAEVLRLKLLSLKKQREAHSAEIERLQAANDRLRDEFRVEMARELDARLDDTCPCCGQALPAEQVEAAHEKALAEFNRAKAEKLEGINAQGKRSNERIAESEAEIKKLDAEGDRICRELNKVSREADALQAELDELISGLTDVAGHPDYAKLQKAKAALQDKLDKLQSDQATANSGIRGDIAKVRADISALETSKLQIKQHKQGQVRIAELMEQERALAAEFERLEGELYLAEQFTRVKVALLEERINGKFRLARFKLFEQQVNGALNEVCETTYKGVPYGSGLNNAAKIAVGIDIIQTLSEHYGFTAPIFVDNAEAIVTLPDADSQLIALYVSEGDKELRTEVIR